MDKVLVTSKANLLRQLQCEICLESVKDARLCPRCSRFYCHKCIHSWINTSKSCPNCRSALSHKALIKGYSINMMQTTIQELVSSLDRMDLPAVTSDRQHCERHEKVQLNLFCYGCKTNICSKCWFSEDHADHKERVVPLDEAYEHYRKNLETALAWVDEQMQLIDRCEREPFVKLREESVALVAGEPTPVTLMSMLNIERTITELRSKPRQSETDVIRTEHGGVFMSKPTLVLIFRRSIGTSAECKWQMLNVPHWLDSCGFCWSCTTVPPENDNLFLTLIDGKPSKYSVTFDKEPEQVQRFELFKPVLIGHLGSDIQQVTVKIRQTYADRIDQLETGLCSAWYLNFQISCCSVVAIGLLIRAVLFYQFQT